MGGSNRTIIKHTQQLITNPTVGLEGDEVGALVTLDRSYTLLEEVIPTAWRHEVEQVAGAHGGDSLHAKIVRVVALCTDVPGVPLSPRNLAVLLHPSTSADPLEADVRDALADLVREDRLREGDDGYRLQTPKQKNWEKERRQIDIGERHKRLRKTLLRDRLGSLRVTKGRTFQIELTVEREKLTDGDISLDIRDGDDLDALRVTSRAEDNEGRIYWAYETENDTFEALVELYRSEEMIDRHKNDQGDAERFLLQEERKRADRHGRTAGQLLARDLAAGTVVFEGTSQESPEGELQSVAQKVVTNHLDKIYPRLDEFTATVKRTDPVQVLRADSLAGLPDCCGAEGLGVVTITKGGHELVTDSGPIETVVAHIKARKQYNEDQNGRQLERYFGGPPFGCSLQALQVVLAAAMRAGLLEVISQASRITSHTDHRLEPIFAKLPTFRAASFRPTEDTGPGLEVRGEVAAWLQELTGEPGGLDGGLLAQRGRALFAALRQPCTEAKSTLRGAGLKVPEQLDVMDELLARLSGPDDDLVVETMYERRTDLADGRAAVDGLASVVENEMPALRSAVAAHRNAPQLGDPDIDGEAEALGELLARARYGDDLAKIKSHTTKIEQAIASAETSLRGAVAEKVKEATEKLRTRYPSVDDDAFDAVVAPLSQLADASSIPLLRANIQGVEGAVRSVSDALDALVATRAVRHVRAAEVWSAPITSATELDAALGRLREAVLSELDDDTEVRFR